MNYKYWYKISGLWNFGQNVRDILGHDQGAKYCPRATHTYHTYATIRLPILPSVIFIHHNLYSTSKLGSKDYKTGRI